MKRKGKVYCKGQLAGELGETDQGMFVFAYDPGYLNSPSAHPVSLTLPLQRDAYIADHLFPSFTGCSPKAC